MGQEPRRDHHPAGAGELVVASRPPYAIVPFTLAEEIVTDEVAALRGKSSDEVTPGGTLRAYRERKRETDLFAAEGR